MTDAEMSAIEAADAQWVRPPQAVIDMWNDIWKIEGRLDFNTSSKYETHILGKYDPENAPDKSKPFKAYEMWLSYEEAVQVLNEYKWSKGQRDMEGVLSGGCHKAKVAPPIAITWGCSLTDLCTRNSNIEEMCFYIGERYIWGATVTNIYRAFAIGGDVRGKLRKIHGVITLHSNCNVSSSFGSETLELIHLCDLNKNISFNTCPKINLESFQYMVNRRGGTNDITITVHPDVYAKLTGDTTNAAAAALSDDELESWMALVPLAADKNITFATA